MNTKRNRGDTIEAPTRSFAFDVAQYGITVNCVSPGPTQTGWIDEKFEKVVVPLIPMGKLIQPEDIAFCIFVQRAIFIEKLLEFAVIRIILKVFIVFYDAKSSVSQ